jgi:hypothetical protein
MLRDGLEEYGEIINTDHLSQVLGSSKVETNNFISNTSGLKSKKVSNNQYIVFKSNFLDWANTNREILKNFNVTRVKNTQNDLSKIEEKIKEYVPKKVISYNPTLGIPKSKKGSGIRVYDEKKAQKVIAENIHCIEDGMSVVGVEYKLFNNGIADIFAKDENGDPCIIEIKGKGEDQRIVFQMLDYSLNFKGEVRLITLCPYYHQRIFNVLKMFGFVEVKTYDIKRGKYLTVNNL